MVIKHNRLRYDDTALESQRGDLTCQYVSMIARPISLITAAGSS